MVKYDWYIPLSPLCKYCFGSGAKVRTLDFFLLLLGLPRSRAGPFTCYSYRVVVSRCGCCNYDRYMY